MAKIDIGLREQEITKEDFIEIIKIKTFKKQRKYLIEKYNILIKSVNVAEVTEEGIIKLYYFVDDPTIDYKKNRRNSQRWK